MNVLVVAAHPDDEVLGCGGTIARHADRGDRVKVLIAAEGGTSRWGNVESKTALEVVNQLAKSAKKASEILGVTELQMLGYPDNELDTISRLILTREIEAVIDSWKPSIVYVHHIGDVNIDHRRLHEAVITACRPMPGRTVSTLLSYEVQSSTEWQPPGSASPFQPNYFVDVSNQLERKMKALSIYNSEMRDWPHPRSLKAIESQVKWRGSQVGKEAAEAFVILRKIDS